MGNACRSCAKRTLALSRFRCARLKSSGQPTSIALGCAATVLLSEDAGPAQLTIAGAAQAASYSALGYLVLHDTNIWGPNAAGLCANVVCLVLIGVYGSQGGKAGKQPRD